jgi:uracil-DNA glycosylase
MYGEKPLIAVTLVDDQKCKITLQPDPRTQAPSYSRAAKTATTAAMRPLARREAAPLAGAVVVAVGSAAAAAVPLSILARLRKAA